MVRFSAAVIFLIGLTGSLASGQDSVPKVQVFGGYSFMHTGTGGLTTSTLDLNLRQNPGTLGLGSSFNGWNAEVQYNFDRWIGVVADFGGQYGTPFTASSGVSGLPSMNEYSFLAGPVISYRAKARITPFAHALFGWDRAHLNASTITGTSSPVTSFDSAYTSFAVVFGGGVDYNLSRHFALRLGQLDYFRTTLDLNSLYGGAFGPGRFQGLSTHENNLRFSTGIVVRF
ncbi:MAG: outer membrane protein/peptidoglycan-associated protein [Candidatus Sulfotelmatobacter sp.]|nr:outer membrane protein/peptidoglycan-associated protein [Candidatus Sulfotelmatobacter sp.]